MPSIKKSTLPEHSLLQEQQFDYIDCFEGVIIDVNHTLTVTDIGKAFFASAPKWIGVLFVLRNSIVSPFGLKTPDRKIAKTEQLNRFNYDPGERLGLFKVFARTADEIILGEDDKHLDFRISLWLQPVPGTPVKHLIVSTAVRFNNKMGRLYFVPVKPFHRLIVPAMLKGIIRQLSK